MKLVNVIWSYAVFDYVIIMHQLKLCNICILETITTNEWLLDVEFVYQKIIPIIYDMIYLHLFDCE